MAALAAAGFLGRAPASNDLEAQAVALLDRIAALEAVPGAARLQRRVESELDAVRGDDSSGSRLLGAANNLIAVEFELDVWAWAPDGVSLSKTVRPPGQSAATIDVVAAGGAWWIEAKAAQPFGLGSTAWRDLKEQLDRLRCNA
eukprot:CAMPEP_0202776506 /NCGR_PEP_ID=MMETSP1388-20130828/50771_1 /ASSEMBLY_ACC=CAM_ASM_000864 /TAXON_ID=37098 /ORGANISM="Isochrysis sp, Strain CCMP1244" /LENGTH=143 /DNA_ID=CAMNT_0049445687 /DNA_START=20 /DNA_END=447 /DNA_ORIENTATION=-